MLFCFPGSVYASALFHEKKCSLTFTLQCSQDKQQVKCFQRKAEVNHEIQQLKSKMRDSQVCLHLECTLFQEVPCTPGYEIWTKQVSCAFQWMFSVKILFWYLFWWVIRNLLWCVLTNKMHIADECVAGSRLLLISFAWSWSLIVDYLLQLQKFRDELKNRSRVLKKLGHIDADGVVQLKGRAACLIDTGDELLITELMFNGNFMICLLTFCRSR